MYIASYGADVALCSHIHIARAGAVAGDGPESSHERCGAVEVDADWEAVVRTRLGIAHGRPPRESLGARWAGRAGMAGPRRGTSAFEARLDLYSV